VKDCAGAKDLCRTFQMDIRRVMFRNCRRTCGMCHVKSTGAPTLSNEEIKARSREETKDGSHKFSTIFEKFDASMAMLVKRITTLKKGYKDQAQNFVKRPTRDTFCSKASLRCKWTCSELDEAKALARDHEVTQHFKFLKLTQCVVGKLYLFMGELKAKSSEIVKGTGEKAKIEYVCREYVKPVDDFIVRLGERSKLQAVCKPSTGEAVADVDLADELNVDGKTSTRHGWADDQTPTPTESPQVHTASSISGMCEF